MSFRDIGGADFGVSLCELGESNGILCLCRGEGRSDRLRADRSGVDPFSGDISPWSVTGDDGDFIISWNSRRPARDVSESEFLRELQELE